MVARNRRGGPKRRAPSAPSEPEPQWVKDEPTIWSWAWPRLDESNVTLDGGGTKLLGLDDISGNNRHYTGNAADKPPGYQKPLDLRVEWSNPYDYFNQYAPLCRNNYNNQSNSLFGQYMTQSVSMAASAEFYFIGAFAFTRTSGTREIWGTSAADNIRVDQGNQRIAMTVGNGTANVVVCNSSTIPRAPCVVEIWRDNANAIHVAVNGSAVAGSGGTTIAGTFAISGWGFQNPGGEGSSGADDYYLELLNFQGLPAAQFRSDLSAMLIEKHGIVV